MIEAREEPNSVYTEFKCPECGVWDVTFYMSPAFCHHCNTDYDFDVDDIITSLTYRIEYFNTGETPP